MMKLLAPKYSTGNRVKLRRKINAYIGTKLYQFSKGHEFIVTNSYVNLKQKDCKEAFEESGELVEPVFICELKDSNKNEISVYEEDLKRIKIVTNLPDDEEEEDKPSKAVDIPIKRLAPGSKLQIIK